MYFEQKLNKWVSAHYVREAVQIYVSFSTIPRPFVFRILVYRENRLHLFNILYNHLLAFLFLK